MPTNWTTYKKWTRFQQLYNPPKLSQEEIDTLNREITRSEIESVTKKKKKNLPANQSPGPDGFTGEFYQTHKGTTQILLKLFQQAEEGIFPKLLQEATIT